jgi:hypothetical protein
MATTGQWCTAQKQASVRLPESLPGTLASAAAGDSVRAHLDTTQFLKVDSSIAIVNALRRLAVRFHQTCMCVSTCGVRLLLFLAIL